MGGSLARPAAAARWVSSAAAMALAVALSAAGEAAEEVRERPPDAASETESGEAAESNAPGGMRATHRDLRAKAWRHIGNREYDAAIAVLRELQEEEFAGDAAFTHQALAAAFNFKGDYERVLHHQAQIVEQPGDLPPASVRAALMAAGYLSFQQRRFEDAVRYMEAWKADESNPPARFFAMLTRAYRELGDRRKSMDNAAAAVRAAQAEGVAVPAWLEELRDGHRGPEAAGDAVGDGQR